MPISYTFRMRGFRRRRFMRLRRGRRYTRARTYSNRRRLTRMMRRSRGRPELKFAIGQTNQQNLVSLGRTTIPTSPETLLQGTSVSTRVGASVKFIRNTINFYARANPSNTSRVEGFVRFIMWTPRISYTQADLYMTALAPLEMIDYNVATIHKDMYLHFGKIGQGTIGASTNVLQAPNWTEKTFRISNPFPRRVNFRNGNNDVDPNTDVMYLTLINAMDTNLTYDLGSRTTFIDV